MNLTEVRTETGSRGIRQGRLRVVLKAEDGEWYLHWLRYYDTVKLLGQIFNTFSTDASLMVYSCKETHV